jgi:nucleoside-diphosphate-sugar epimerase
MRLLLGYECRTTLREGLEKTIAWLEENYPRGTVRL